ncbi:hypothetical protein [Nostoc sp. DedSLP04]|uniref:hypothetical protein n=1 Tax=Nostoc sp. DedSLP04 TaxID=3075401 RepID=UPI002AD4ED77|nr:hypothetical protein [Nostoc sp. DedSLP04]
MSKMTSASWSCATDSVSKLGVASPREALASFTSRVIVRHRDWKISQTRNANFFVASSDRISTTGTFQESFPLAM